MWQDIQIWGFLAGLGLFLLGMFMLEQGLRGIVSQPLKVFLRNHTKSPIQGVLTGTVTTALLQSSSLVGLIVLAFVGVGILELRNALGIIFGCNLGTTFTGWVVASIGFKLDLIRYAQPLLAFGALGTVFLEKDRKPFYYSNLLLGLGLLLAGLGEMKDGFSTLAENADVSVFRGHSPIIYVIAGVLFTAVIQSSSATIMILLGAVHAGVVSINDAVAVVIGADLGTTSTVLLGSIGASVAKRRVALSHFFFNLCTAIIAFSLLPLLVYFLTDILGIKDKLYTVVAFHSLFNTIGIVIFVPLVNYFVRFLEWLVADKDELLYHYINKVPPDITDMAVDAVYKQLEEFINLAIALNLHCLRLGLEEVYHDRQYPVPDKPLPYEDRYALLKRSEGEALGYTYTVQKASKDENDIRVITGLNHAIRNVAYSAKFIKDVRHNLMDFRHSGYDKIDQCHERFRTGIREIYRKYARLVANRNPELSVEYILDVKAEIRARYEDLIQDIYSISGEDIASDEEISSLLNLNRSVYLSNSALLESIRVMLKIQETEAALSAAAPVSHG
jgi:phosphate:Na+ symporter